jgi:hypothetical protein
MPFSDRQVDLAWNPATDPDTGIVMYKVFRDGIELSTVKGWAFSDTGLVEQTPYSYTVSAVNYHGVEGAQSVPVSTTTPVDVTPPGVVSVNASGPADAVTLVFDEAVDEISAETPINYAIDHGVSVTTATRQLDLKTVMLRTSEHVHDTTYQVTVNNVLDQAKSPNPITPGTHVRYTYSRVPGLVGAWSFDEDEGETAFDTANYGNDGALLYTQSPGPTWVAGRVGGALQFDGVDDQVTICGSGSLEDVTDHSYTFAAWAWADSVPPNTTPNNPMYSVLVRNYTGLTYDSDRRFRAQIRLADGSEVAVWSGAFAPGSWHHLAMMVDDEHKKLALYVDGNEVSGSPVPYAGALADHKTAPYYVGTSEPLTERYEYRYYGKIDQLRIYDRALNLREVQTLRGWTLTGWLYLRVILRMR